MAIGTNKAKESVRIYSKPCTNQLTTSFYCIFLKIVKFEKCMNYFFCAHQCKYENGANRLF
jgi:hypothetical protein